MGYVKLKIDSSWYYWNEINRILKGEQQFQTFQNDERAISDNTTCKEPANALTCIEAEEVTEERSMVEKNKEKKLHEQILISEVSEIIFLNIKQGRWERQIVEGRTFRHKDKNFYIKS